MAAKERIPVNQMSPAIDRAIAPVSGATRDGQPISFNRAPAPDLAPWIARLYVTQIAAPDDHRIDCGLFNDMPFVRIQIGGRWRVETPAGPVLSRDGAFLMGPQSRRMPVRVTGGFLSFGLALRPGALRALRGPAMPALLDRVLNFADLGDDSGPWLALAQDGAAPEALVAALETHVRAAIARIGAALPDAITRRFEHAALTDPSFAVADFARRHGVEQRRLQRIVKRDFGMTPKAVLRRARVLDLASHLRGVADAAEADALALRYYDQSHMIREFTALFGLSPRQFATRPQPLMTAALENRQARRLEMLDRLEPGAARPWG
jgi:AraC-like DNA-binding protein